MFDELLETAQKNVASILQYAIELQDEPVLVVYDSFSEMSKLLAKAYRGALPQGRFLAFEEHSPEWLLEAIFALPAGALVVLVQSNNFRLNAFRLRVELFKCSYKVLEHLHLERTNPQEARVYVDALDYDPEYYRTVGPALQAKIAKAQSLEVRGRGGYQLWVQPTEGLALEEASLNIGDYRGMKNIGGLYPIGEVFTEAKSLESMNGKVPLFAFADLHFEIALPNPPIVLVIEAGQVVGVENSTPEFDAVLEKIRLDEEVVWVREIGLGLNRAFSAERRVRDVATYERICGMHLSLGAKHTVYPKAHLKKKFCRHHVDVFVDLEAFLLDGENLWNQGAWLSGMSLSED
jgi:aminopeptidase